MNHALGLAQASQHMKSLSSKVKVKLRTSSVAVAAAYVASKVIVIVRRPFRPEAVDDGG